MLLPAINTLSAENPNPEEEKDKLSKMFLDYLAAFPNVTIVHTESDIIL